MNGILQSCYHSMLFLREYWRYKSQFFKILFSSLPLINVSSLLIQRCLRKQGYNIDKATAFFSYTVVHKIRLPESDLGFSKYSSEKHIRIVS